ncbi:uncharacterized protein LY89DRAFT_239477 [Mollisia scopiformis]|uniref:Uncharacterized protein n=1 Tax=Mollisia scopiformis TaxID=149040 RepID=A0A194WU50_MOLSC|nr:uncharacterized protein LY89DRAFT_239477 [Mollisia scopiformis]KUJ11204.1 hypothetical protein LY89DRAFT_239477 [Mollisia scopiformis]
MNSSTIRRLVQGTKTRIKAANTPRDDILKAVEYQKLLSLVDELDFLLASLAEMDVYAMKDFEAIAGVKEQRKGLAEVLRRLLSDSAHANSDGRAINRWRYKKKLHAVSKELVRGVEGDVLRLREVCSRASEPASFSTAVENNQTENSIYHRTVETPPPNYFDTSVRNPRPETSVELPTTAQSPTIIPPSHPPTTNSNIAISSTTTHPRGCILILSLVATFVLFSCISGLYFTLNKSLGYSMGDAFTLAGYIIAVGTLVSSAALARHWPSCRCWKGKDRACGEVGDG